MRPRSEGLIPLQRHSSKDPGDREVDIGHAGLGYDQASVTGLYTAGILLKTAPISSRSISIFGNGQETSRHGVI
jgi:hypothetical protein